MAGYRFETPELVERMLQHLQSIQGALPLLQFAATRLWEARDASRKLLTERAYEEMGGIGGALATHADSVLAGLSAGEQALARALLLRLVTPERTRAIVSMEELGELSKDAGEIQRLTQHLIQARLLVVQTGGGGAGATVELVHESLIQSWPMLRRWLDESQEDADFLEQLRSAARQWQAKGHDGGLLWRGDMVEEARRFKRRYRGELPKLQGQFLDAVLANAAKAVRFRRMLLGTAVAVLLLMVAASAVAVVLFRGQQRKAEQVAIAAKEAEDRATRNMRAAQESEARRAAAQREAEEARQRAEEDRRRAMEAMGKLSAARRAAQEGEDAAKQKAEEARLAKEALEKQYQEERERKSQWGLIYEVKKLEPAPKKGAKP
jgi:hypothetical protein